MSEHGVEKDAVVQMLPGGKWHRVWWNPWMATQGTVLTHVGAYRPERNPVRGRAEVAVADLCRVCFPTSTRTTPPTEDRA